jgi:alanine-glyoxylate transaminase/serine-glyoxylate transaminase/serine-pyruvate transaminase
MPPVTGRTYLAIPGPSVIPERVLNAMHRVSPNIYQGEIIDLTWRALDGLKQLAGTRHHVAIYIANGHGGWEAAITNMFSRGDKALGIGTGLFGVNWARTAQRMGVEVELLDFGRSAADPDRIAAALRADAEGKIKWVTMTHVDTASSIKNDVAAVRAAIDAAGHNAMLAVDTIASMGCDEFRMDDWGVDLVVGASQKGLMLPPGLALLSLKAAGSADLATPYWSITPRIDPAEYWLLFGGTPPTQHLYGLEEVLKMLLVGEGLEAAWARHAKLARAIWTAFDAWGQTGSGIGLNVKEAHARGHSVTAATIPNGGAGRLRAWLEQEAGVTLGIGLGMAKSNEPEYGDYLRIGHMGHVNAHMVMGVLGTMEAGMCALGIPHGPGAIEAAARSLSAA